MTTENDEIAALKGKAEEGDVDAQRTLGYIYYEGDGVPQNYTEAIKWYRLAAEQGNVEAQEWLGVMYSNGEGVPVDKEESAKWYRLAYENEDAIHADFSRDLSEDEDAKLAALEQKMNESDPETRSDMQCVLGINYLHGEGFEQDEKKALKWLRIAAENGSSGAQTYLGEFYKNGDFVPQDYIEAYVWLSLADSAKKHIIDMDDFDNEAGNLLLVVEACLSPADRSRAHQKMLRRKEEIEKYLNMANIKWRAKQGDVEAQVDLSEIYFYGKGVQKDYDEAVKWIRLAAEQEDGDAQFIFGLMHADGRGVQQNKEEAAKWIRLAAEQGHAIAQNNLGIMYYEGEGIQQNYRDAYIWFYFAAENGDENAPENRKKAAEKLTSVEVADAQAEAKKRMKAIREKQAPTQ